jgi:hypothetical protein
MDCQIRVDPLNTRPRMPSETYEWMMVASSAYPPPEVCSLRADRATSRALVAPAVITSGLAVIIPGGRPVNCLRDGVIRDG